MGALDCVTKRMTPTDSTEVFTVNMSSNTSLNKRKDLESQLLKPTSDKRFSIRWILGVDIPLLVTALVLLGLFEFGVIPQHKRGFFCNDPALSYPFTGDTVSMATIVSTILLIPFVVVFITEWAFFEPGYTKQNKYDYIIRKTLSLYREYSYGLFFNFIVLEVLKGVTGNPRPMFFDLCEPDTAKTCNGSEFVSTFECTSTKYSSWYQSDSYKSFPSGHTSLSLHCGIFTAWYLQRRAFSWRNRTVFLVPATQMLCAAYCAVCSMTRLTDHRHHWWDVLVGAGLGTVSALYTVIVLCNNFNRNEWSEDTTASRQTVQTFDGTQVPVQ